MFHCREQGKCPGHEQLGPAYEQPSRSRGGVAGTNGVVPVAMEVVGLDLQ
jgi:hypothetical protein